MFSTTFHVLLRKFGLLFGQCTTYSIWNTCFNITFQIVHFVVSKDHGVRPDLNLKNSDFDSMNICNYTYLLVRPKLYDLPHYR